MANFSSDSKLSYVYDAATDTWHPIAGLANASLDYNWSGSHSFASTVTMEQVLQAKGGVNNFQNPSERDTAIPSPVNGLVAFVRQTDSGVQINQLQYYYSGAWKEITSPTFYSTSGSISLTLDNAGMTITLTPSSGSTSQITVPANSSVSFPIGTKIEFIRLGEGNVIFTGDLGVNVFSKYDDKSLAAQYSAAVLTKVDTNTWILIGDLTTI